MNILLSPHNDDETLFAAFIVMRFDPCVITCLRSVYQERYGISYQTREAETEAALNELHPTALSLQFTIPDVDVDWVKLHDHFLHLDKMFEPELVFAPAVEDGGHEHHTEIGQLALDIWGTSVRSYLTYRRGYGRSTSDKQLIPTPEEHARKWAAMQCYQSQINLDNTAPWFAEDSGWAVEHLETHMRARTRQGAE